MIDEAEVIYWGTCPDCTHEHSKRLNDVQPRTTGEGPNVSESENPVIDAPEPKPGRPHSNQDWWPNQLDLSVLHQHSPAGNPLGADFDYKSKFASLDIEELKQDVKQVLNTSQDWWPADFGHYGGLMIRLSWHAAGTYRIEDGRGGAGDGSQRFAPLNSWPDNANLDKARRLLWPVKQKHGQKISWADLLVFAGNVALEDMGFETFGFGFGREDVWEPEEIFWGPEDTWLGDERYSGERELAEKLGAVQMGLIYVNPEGPNGEPDPLKAAHDIRETFTRMAMNDEETVALIAGGHSFGKTHGAASGDYVGLEPEGCPVDRAGPRLAEHLRLRQGRRRHHLAVSRSPGPAPRRSGATASSTTCSATSGSSRRAPPAPTSGSPRTPRRPSPTRTARPTKRKPTMLTTDLSLRLDPEYEKISRRFHADLDEFRLAFAKAWYKLLHRDMGPVDRYLGPWSPSRSCGRTRCRRTTARWSPTRTSPRLKAKLLESGLGVDQLVRTAWASAASFRDTDKRGGANGARIRLAPQKDWEVNEPDRARRRAGEARAGAARSSTAPAAPRSRWPT